MKPCLMNNRGVSLVELMVVLVVLAVGLIPIAAVQTRSNRDVFHSGQRTEALSIAQMQMERARSAGFNNAVSDSGSVGVYEWKLEVQTAGYGLNSVQVTVQWREKARPRQLEFNSLLSMR